MNPFENEYGIIKKVLENLNPVFSNAILVAVLSKTNNLIYSFQKSSNGQQLLERVFTHMDILERDYFGLKYLDANSVSQWLDPRKPIKKQSKDKGKKHFSISTQI